MTTLITSGGSLLSTGGPYQLTSTGRRSLAAGSRPFDLWPAAGGSVSLFGGATVSYAQLFRSQPWVATAVKKLGSQITRLPLKTYEFNSQNDKVRVRDNPLADLIQSPWKRASTAKLKQQLAFPMYVHGNSLTAKVRPSAGAPPTSFKPLDWRYVRPIKIEPNLVEAWETTEFGQREYFAPEDVIHLTWWAPDGPIGISPLEQLGVTIRAEDAAQRYLEALHKNAARPGFAVTLPAEKRADREVRAAIREEIQGTHGGVDKSFLPMILGGGAAISSVSQTAQEAELIESRKVNREEIAAVYDIPPPLIGILDKATYSNIETQHGMLYTDVLGPVLVLVEQELTAQLVSEEPAFQGLFLEFDLAGVLRGDKLKEIQSLREAIGTGLMKPNEGRSVLNLPRVGDPDDDEDAANQLYMPVNNLRPMGSDPTGPPPPERPPEPPTQ